MRVTCRTEHDRARKPMRVHIEEPPCDLKEGRERTVHPTLLKSMPPQVFKHFGDARCVVVTGLEITAGQRTMSGLIVDLTGQTFVLPVMLTGQNSIVLKMK